MPNTSRIALHIATFAIPTLLLASGTLAEDRVRGAGPPQDAETQGTAASPQAAPDAPVGHRQPRASDRPAATTGSGTADPFDKRIIQLNREAGRGLRICRDC
jgi:hypothetical protein